MNYVTRALWVSLGVLTVFAGSWLQERVEAQARPPVQIFATDGTTVRAVAVDSSGNFVTGGGTQYTEGATDTTITGNAILWEDGSDTLVVVSSTKPLPVALITSTPALDLSELPAAATLANDLAIPSSTLIGAICMVKDASASNIDFCADTTLADEVAFTYATSRVQPAGFVAESTTDAAADGTVVAAVTTLLRQLRTVPTPSLSGGGQGVTFASAGSTEDEHAVCTGPCTLYGLVATNHAAAGAFLRCENDTAGNTTPGSETASDGEPDIEIPGNTAGAGVSAWIPVGASYATALTCWVVTGEASTDVAEVGANDVHIWYVRQQ